jgi:hypothetical protein
MTRERASVFASDDALDVSSFVAGLAPLAAPLVAREIAEAPSYMEMVPQRPSPTCAESVGRIKRINGLSEKSALQRRSDCDAVRR